MFTNYWWLLFDFDELYIIILLLMDKISMCTEIRRLQTKTEMKMVKNVREGARLRA
jgi:hypothetical protein